MIHDRRVPFYIAAVDPLSPLYNNNDSDGEHGPEREIDFTSRGNCWSSVSLLSWAEHCEKLAPGFGLLDDDLSECLHLPVFDIDVPVTGAVERAVLGQFRCGAHNIHYVPSTNHHHCYVHLSYPFSEYIDKLTALVTAEIVEPGYLHATEKRTASFVRKSGVRKLEVTP